MVVSGGGDNFSACGFLEGALAAPQSELARSQVLLEVIGARAAVGVRTHPGEPALQVPRSEETTAAHLDRDLTPDMPAL
jgi:hypothetical protein